MNTRILIAGLFFTGCLMNVAGADVFGNLKKAGDVVKKSMDSDQKDAGKEESGKTSEKASAGSTASSGKHPPVSSAKDRKFPPGLSFSSLLNGIKYLPQKAQLQLNHVQATFLPEDGREGYTILRKADGKELYKMEWKSQKLKQPYFLLDVWKVTDLQSGKQVTTYWADLKERGTMSSTSIQQPSTSILSHSVLPS